ncbi:hypothetical protein CSC94_22045 [Zhengella mangrovi]|uniref:Uncharacterized protein n=1 Tax=Zhengella mangrovi TaxID=1982044 RepID=A0A2G1QHD2_9HYPH|nr:hypothetical protein [Zhengella mangrovi]PHP64870.1 hypothetical protein CSC94_22045 [Zhengella mangrovi]
MQKPVREHFRFAACRSNALYRYPDAIADARPASTFAGIALALVASLAAATPAQAINRYNVDHRSCDDVHDIIDDDGAAILRYTSPSGSGMTLYDRFVRHGGYCPTGQVATPVYIPVAGTRSCPVLACKDPVWQEND